MHQLSTYMSLLRSQSVTAFATERDPAEGENRQRAHLASYHQGIPPIHTYS